MDKLLSNGVVQVFSSSGLFACRMECEMDERIRVSYVVMRVLLQYVMVNKLLNQKLKLLIS